jgi:hypothetical protein
LDKWNAFDYSTNLPRYIDGQLTFEASLHSPHEIVASLNYGDMTSAGQEAASAHIGAGMEGMDKATAVAVLEHHPCPFSNWCGRYVALAKKTTLYLQMTDNSDPSGSMHAVPPSLQELTGPLPPLLVGGIALHAQIFEIFPQDWLLALDPLYPGYAEFHLEYQKALAAAAAVVD